MVGTGRTGATQGLALATGGRRVHVPPGLSDHTPRADGGRAGWASTVLRGRLIRIKDGPAIIG
jgi:hypothetical protein